MRVCVRVGVVQVIAVAAAVDATESAVDVAAEDTRRGVREAERGGVL